MNLKKNENNKQLIESTVNAYILGGMLTASEYGKIDVKDEYIKSLLEYYGQKNEITVDKSYVI